MSWIEQIEFKHRFLINFKNTNSFSLSSFAYLSCLDSPVRKREPDRRERKNKNRV